MAAIRLGTNLKQKAVKTHSRETSVSEKKTNQGADATTTSGKKKQWMSDSTATNLEGGLTQTLARRRGVK